MNSCYNNSKFKNEFGFYDKKVIGYFSLNDKYTINFDSSQLRYYIPAENQAVHFDLKGEIDISRRYDDRYINRHIDKILHWIQKYYEKIACFEGGKKWIQPNFVCRRGTIEKILRIPCYSREDTIICAAKWKETIYLCKFDTEAARVGKANQEPFHHGVPYWSGQFNQYMISETPNGPPDAIKPMDQNLEFSCVFLSSLGDHKLLYSAEINAVCSDKKLEDPLPLDELKFIEFKTPNICETTQDNYYFKTSCVPNWWCQCVPVGVENVVCGFKDRNGIVKELNTYSIDDLIDLSREVLNPSTSMKFLNDFLTLIASTVVDDCDKTIYKFEKIPYGDFQITEVSPSSEYSFLPQWYTESTFSK